MKTRADEFGLDPMPVLTRDTAPNPARIRRGQRGRQQLPRVSCGAGLPKDRAAPELCRRRFACRKQQKLAVGLPGLLIEADDAVSAGPAGLKWIENHGQAAFPVL